MRVVIAMPGGPAGERFESLLRSRGYPVMRFEEAITKREVLDTAGEVFVCGDRRTIKTVLASALEPAPHVIAALPKLDDKSVAAALGAGAVDVMSSSAGAEELAARITLPERLALERDAENSGRMRTTETWKSARSIVSERVGFVLDRPIEAGPFDGAAPQIAARARITCREDGSTLDVLIGCAKSSGKGLVGLLVPDTKPSIEALRDGLRELANHLSGSIKQAIISEGVAVTLGLPCDAEADAFVEAHETWAVEVEGVEIVLGLVSGRGGPRMVPVGELEPGMVLKHDVLNAGGMPFIRAGTALTERTISRLSEVLGDATAILVAHGRLGYAEELDEDGAVLFEAS